MGKLFNLDSPVFSFLNKAADLIWLNILTFICCIPVVTIGASMTALNYVVLKMVRNEEGYITRSYFKSFKQNFKQATVIWLILLAVIMVLAGDFYILRYALLEFPTWIKVALLAVVVLFLISSMHLFPALAKFDNTIKNTFKNSFLMGILSLPKTILMIFCWAAPVVVGLTLYQIMPLVFAFGISLPAYMCALLYNKTFKRFEPEDVQADDSEWSLLSEEEKETMEISAAEIRGKREKS